jgi:hypothetical protein
VLVDTNLLILYLVGLSNRSRIPRFKRTQIYSEGDFDLLRALLGPAKALYTTPHILTEVSDLVKLESPDLDLFLREFARWVGWAVETTPPAVRIVEHELLRRLGFADTGIAKACDDGPAVLTDDLNLYLALAERGFPVVNFNHARSHFLGL